MKTAMFSSPLHQAAVDGDMDALQEVLTAGANANEREPRFGLAPLCLAAERGHVAVCRLLLAFGANVRETGRYGQTALEAAVRGRQPDVCQLLIDAGADVHHRVIQMKQTLLHLAAGAIGSDGRAVAGTAELRTLVKAGADVNALADEFRTPLHMAADNVDACRYLVSVGASPSLIPEDATEDYRTPFQYAVTGGNAAVLSFFVEECGEDLSQTTLDGETMEELAGDDEDIQILLRSLKSSMAIKNSIEGAQDADGLPKQSRSLSPL